MYKDYRINTEINTGDKVLKVNLKQGIDTFKILSLEINPEEEYLKQTSNYGVIVGRVLGNGSLGVPNVKVSVFVPLDSTDENDDAIASTYPFKTIMSQDDNGVRYNLLPDDEYSGRDGLHKSIGTFPNKTEVLDNDEECDVYEKYWQYTTVTNDSGDYMIFGVPTGSCQVRYDCDLSDIGLLSQRPYDLINKGYDANLFKSAVEFKDTDDPNTAIYVINQTSTVFVYPFWGDSDANKIGITRHDINIDYNFEPTCVFLGSSITDSPGTYFGVDGIPTGSNGRFNSLVTSRGNIELIRYTEDDVIEQLTANTTNVIDDNGVWCYQIPMNLDRIYTDEEGNLKPTKVPGKGVPTRARVRFRISLTNTDNDSNGEHTAKILVPCNPKLSSSVSAITIDRSDVSQEDWDNYYEFGSKTPDCAFRDLKWGKVYSIKQYYPRIEYDVDENGKIHRRENTLESGVDYAGYPRRFGYPFSCISSIDNTAGLNPFPYTTMYAGAENENDSETYNWFYNHLSEISADTGFVERGLHFCFENDWINGCLYFPKVKIIRQNNTYSYYGEKDSYPHLFYTGRHNCKIDDATNTLTTRQAYAFKWSCDEKTPDASTIIDQDNTSIFSHVLLSPGLLEKKVNSNNQVLFYYKCGGMTNNNVLDQYYILYATDIITLGNLSDIYDSLPQLYKNLPSTTATFPPLVPPRTLNEAGMNMDGYIIQLERIFDDGGYNSDDVDLFGNVTRFKRTVIGEILTDLDTYNYDRLDNYTGESASVEANCIWQETNNECQYIETPDSEGKKQKYVYHFAPIRRIQERSSVFFGYKCRGSRDFLHYTIPSFVNTSRICELDVVNDHAVTVNGTIYSMNGLIDRNDIANNANRAAFASMNFDITNTYEDSLLGYKNLRPTPLYPVDFDGRLRRFIDYRGVSNVTEARDESYVQFRYGQSSPRRYACDGSGFKPRVLSGVTYTNETEYTAALKKYCETICGRFDPARAESASPGYNTPECSAQAYYRFVSALNQEKSTFGYIENNEDLPLPQNSFYFYFGLRSGSSALDKFNSTYGMPQADEYEESPTPFTVKVSSTEQCVDEELARQMEITINGQILTTPCELTLTKNGITIYNDTIYYDALKLIIVIPVALKSGLYVLTLVDGDGKQYVRKISITPNVLSISYKSATDENGKRWFKLNTIDGVDMSNYTWSSREDSNTIQYCPSGEAYPKIRYVLEFDNSFTPSSSKTNEKLIFDGSPNTVNVRYWRETKQIKTIYSSCEKSQLELSYTNKATYRIQLNDVDSEVIKPWGSGNTWDSLATLDGASSNYSFGIDTELSERLNSVANMARCVYNNEQMAISYDDSEYTPITLYPNTETFKDLYGITEKASRIAVTPPTSLIALRYVSNNGKACVESDYYMPNLVAQNFPNALDTSNKSYFRTPSGLMYRNNPFYAYTLKEDSSVENAANNYFGLIGGDSDKPSTPVTPRINTLTGVRQAWAGSISEITGMFSIQTVDKRFDYDISMQTPLVLPSGYDLFTNLKDKSIRYGYVDAKFYGGLRIDHDNIGNQTCYSINGLGQLQGSPTSSATLYEEYIYEDAITNASSGKGHFDGLEVCSDTIVNQVMYNDCLHVKGVLSGSTKFGVSLKDCQLSPSTNSVVGNKSLSANISYGSGILVNHDDYTSKYSYDVLYCGEFNNATTNESTILLYPSLSGSSFSFTMQADSSYTLGSTYTDISFDNNSYGTGRTYVETMCGNESYDGLHLDFCSYNGKKLVTYNLERKDLDNATSMSVQYNPEVSYYTIGYTDSDTNRVMTNLDDSTLSNVYKFNIGQLPSENKDTKSPDQGGYFVLKTRKRYTGTDPMLLNQAYVVNQGYAYYGSYIVVEYNLTSYKVRLYSPLRNADGTIDYTSTGLTSTNNGPHTVGKMKEYYIGENAPGHVTYDESKLEFTITEVGSYDKYIELYFEIENGFRYKVYFKPIS